MLEINGLFISYGPVEVVHGVTMHVEQGKIVSLIGPNGAGKSSVLRAVSGLIRPTGGDIVFFGASLIGVPPHEIATAGIAHVMEGRHLFGGLTVEDNLLLAGSANVSTSAGSMEAIYQRWPILGERRHQLAGTLSGGEQQMLAIARALIGRPQLLLLDEPSWGLAPRIVRELMQAFRQLRSEGMTIFLVEQMAKMALQICNYGYVMTNGGIVLEGSAQELLSKPDLQTMYLGGEVGGKKRAETGTKPSQEADFERADLRKAQEKIAPSFKEKERHKREKVKQKPVTLPEAELLPPLAEAHHPDEEIFGERERLRQIRQQSFGSGKAFSELKEELSRIRREVSGIKELRTTPEEKAHFTPSFGKKDWRSFEKQRRERQAGWKPTKISEPKTKVGPPGPEPEKVWESMEAARRERQASHIRGAATPLSSEMSDRSKHEHLRQKREEEWNKKRGTGQETEIFRQIRPPKDRLQFEMKRREKEREHRTGDHMGSHSPALEKKQIDWKSRELARQRRQAETQKKEKWQRA